MNKQIVDKLKTIKSQYQNQKDVFRVRAYDNAIFSIESLSKPLCSIEDVHKVGKSMKSHIQEFLDTGTIKKADDIQNVNSINTVDSASDLEKVWGIGPKKAKKLESLGYKTIQDLLEDPYQLTRQQLIGLKYYDDLLKRLDRSDINQFKFYVNDLLSKRFGKKFFKFQIAGSYRRDAPTSGDIDMVITSRKFNLDDVVQTLSYNKFITEILSSQTEKCMCVAIIPGIMSFHFRLDIEFVKEEEYYPCLLYFTGSKDFNIAMRARAKKMGMRLNQHGLFKVVEDTEKKIKVRSEEDIFEKLNLVYVQPNKR